MKTNAEEKNRKNILRKTKSLIKECDELQSQYEFMKKENPDIRIPFLEKETLTPNQAP